MLKSMTGYGRGLATTANYRLTLELKAVNNRYLEVVVHAPRLLLFLEAEVKNQVAQYAARGKVDVYIQLESIAEQPPVLQVDKALAAAYAAAAKELAAAMQLPLGQELKMERLLTLPGLVSLTPPETDSEAQQAELGEALRLALAEALPAFAAMRALEGGRLQADLLRRQQLIAQLVQQLAQQAEQVPEAYQARLRTRLAELLPAGVPLDEARLANEVAIFADRACIDEELVRLQSHLAQLNQLLQAEEPVGRKLDFLLQELNREVNTIGSKANALALSQLVIAAKSELEKVREQIQNIE